MYDEISHFYLGGIGSVGLITLVDFKQFCASQSTYGGSYICYFYALVLENMSISCKNICDDFQGPWKIIIMQAKKFLLYER